jgi:uncharacterized oligopeptide transporter (OPT) family protein
MESAGDESELRWLREVYQGDAPQLTLRAIATGAAIGAVLCLSNLYVQLKLSLAMGVAVTACILAHTLSRTLARLSGGRWTPFGMIETNTAQSVASAAGYSTGCTMATAIAGYLLVTGRRIPSLPLFAWTLCLAGLGVCFAVPFKRQMIDVEQLPFPTGTAAAQTLRSLHARGGSAGVRALGIAGALGGLVALWRDALSGMRLALPRVLSIPLAFGDLTLGCDVSVLLAGAGALIGVRTALSMAVGTLVCFGVVTPWARAHGGIAGAGLEPAMGWAMWTGSAVLATASVLGLLLDGRALVVALRGLGLLRAAAHRRAGIEVPARWFWIGSGVLGCAAALIARATFGVPIIYGLIAVALTFVLCAVACRVTGETDATPTGALGQITQLVYGGLMPQNLIANLMTASITGSAAAAAADLLSDLKSGWLVGANPRRQFVAQLCGCLVGAAVIVPAFNLLIPDAHALGGARFPAPGAAVLAGVARVLAAGVGALHPTIVTAMKAGALVGGALALLERVAPLRVRRWLPSGAGLGLAFLLPPTSALAMLLGALCAAAYLAGRGERGMERMTTVASGLIAGESVVGIVIALLAAAGLVAI